MNRVLKTVCIVLGTLAIIAGSLFLINFGRAQEQTEGSRQAESEAQELQEKQKIYAENHRITSAALTEEETERILQQSEILKAVSADPVNNETANVLAEYFVRCSRLDPDSEDPQITAARFQEHVGDAFWDYWILTSSTGIDYWIWGSDEHDSFSVFFVNKSSPEGEWLYGRIE